MSRRKLQWKRRAAQAGGVEKILPGAVTGAGKWLTKTTIEGKSTNPEKGTGEGASVSKPVSTRKEQLIRNWAK